MERLSPHRSFTSKRPSKKVSKEQVWAAPIVYHVLPPSRIIFLRAMHTPYLALWDLLLNLAVITLNA